MYKIFIYNEQNTINNIKNVSNYFINSYKKICASYIITIEIYSTLNHSHIKNGIQYNSNKLPISICARLLFDKILNLNIIRHIQYSKLNNYYKNLTSSNYNI